MEPDQPRRPAASVPPGHEPGRVEEISQEVDHRNPPSFPRLQCLLKKLEQEQEAKPVKGHRTHSPPNRV